MKKIQNLIGCLLLIIGGSFGGYAQKIVGSLDELWSYAQAQSFALKNNDVKTLQAKNTRLAAMFNIADLQANINGSFLNNTRLPVSVLPAEAFGGQPGTTREIQTGTPYNTGFGQSADIKLVNLGGWADYRLAKLNLNITETDNKLNQKSLYENIAVAYYNVIQLQEQLKSTQKSVTVADSLLQITQNKYLEGLVKQQDVNDAKVSWLNTKENARQIEYLITQQILSLKILTDIPENSQLQFSESIGSKTDFLRPDVAKNYLSLGGFQQKELYAKESIKKQSWAMMPTLSFVFNNAYNQYNQDFTIAGGRWINSQYIGLKLNFALPNAQSISSQSKAKFEYQMALNNTRQAAIKTDLEHQKLQTDFDKANAQIQTNTEVLALQKDTYQRNKNLYLEGLQGIDRTLNSFSNWLNAEYNLVSSQVSLALAKAKISINNKIQ
jgi:outer membrane protein TolC